MEARGAHQRSLTLMFAVPPAVLLLWAHFLRQFYYDSDLLALAVALTCGIIGVETSPWPRRSKVWAGILYALLGLPALMAVTLVAACSAGYCDYL